MRGTDMLVHRACVCALMLARPVTAPDSHPCAAPAVATHKWKLSLSLGDSLPLRPASIALIAERTAGAGPGASWKARKSGRRSADDALSPRVNFSAAGEKRACPCDVSCGDRLGASSRVCDVGRVEVGVGSPVDTAMAAERRGDGSAPTTPIAGAAAAVGSPLAIASTGGIAWQSIMSPLFPASALDGVKEDQRQAAAAAAPVVVSVACRSDECLPALGEENARDRRARRGSECTAAAATRERVIESGRHDAVPGPPLVRMTEVAACLVVAALSRGSLPTGVDARYESSQSSSSELLRTGEGAPTRRHAARPSWEDMRGELG